MTVAALGRKLRTEATEVDERRLIVLAGDRDRGYETARVMLDATGIPFRETTQIGSGDRLPCERIGVRRTTELLGRTRTAIVIDAHDELRPNALGQSVGAVDGGGLVFLLTPPLDEWVGRHDDFDAGLAAPPFSCSDVTGLFRRRLIDTLYRHRGVAIVDVDADEVVNDGLTDPAPRLRSARPAVSLPDEHAFPSEAYDRCLTADQASALEALEAVRGHDVAVVVEADRGRGKSSAAGFAAGCLAADGEDILVTAPEYRSAGELFARAEELLKGLDVLADSSRDDPKHTLTSTTGGRVRYRSPTETVGSPAVDTLDGAATDADVVFVDEAAALPVSVLSTLLDADRIVFSTTVHGYEGAGRGFSVRFRDRLDESTHEVIDVRLDEPIRYAAGDPVETWVFDALLLDARPAVDQLVGDLDPADVDYRRLDPADLLADEHRLREAFGLLVLAHYRTEPDDLARLLDGPNLATRALIGNGRVVAVSLLAREGGLLAGTRAHMYDGGRVRGNMLPDVLTTQLRDEDAARPVGVRVVRIATHPAVRSRGFGSRLLEEIRAEADDGLPEFADAPRPEETVTKTDRSDSAPVDWLGVGYGATPDLLSFWRSNGYRTAHLATTRTDASGEYSALMLHPLSNAGVTLADRTTRRFARRIPAVLADALSDADPDVVRGALRAIDASALSGDDSNVLSDDGSNTLAGDDSNALSKPDLTEWEWEVVAGAAYGPGLFDAAPGPFARLAVAYFADHPDPDDAPLSAREERLLVLRALQARDWQHTSERLGYHSTGQCMRALGTAVQPLVDRYGTATAHEVRRRYADD